MTGPNSRNSQTANASRNDTAFMATFDLDPGFFIYVIQLDWYCRSYSIRVRPQGFGPTLPRPVFIAFSKTGIEGIPGGQAAFHTLFTDEEPMQRFFWRDDEGPPFIWIANASPTLGIRCHFEYFPTRKRQGSSPMATRDNPDFPPVTQIGATIIPGV